MKNKINAFLTVTLLSLMIAPAVNIISGKTLNRQEDASWWDYSHLYNMDFALPVLGGIFYSLGFSVAPEQVVIGKEGWLFLGDGYSNSITTKRVGATLESAALLEKVTDAANAWNAWLKKNGVKEYRILIAPDKDSIYPEYIPKWAAHASPSLTDILMKTAGTGIYVDSTNSLLLAKQEFNKPLYYKTDTHWNSLGAWIGFSQIAENLSRTQPGLIWPNRDIHSSLSVTERKAGDLAKFQRIQSYLPDTEVIIDDFSKDPIPVEQYDYATGKLLTSGDNAGIEAPRTPLLVKSKNALNHKKVLWLRDSFGIAMAPFMAATFSETLQLHHALAEPEILSELVKKFKPDYVLIEVVERDSRGGHFILLPPMSILNSRAYFTPIAKVFHSTENDLSVTGDQDNYRVTGIDPYISFKLSRPVQTKEANQIVFELKCTNGSNKIPVQLFWRAEGTEFNEMNSVYFSANQGITSLDISVNPAWAKIKDVADIRLDLVSPTECPTVEVKNLEVGVIQAPQTSY